MSGKGLGGEGVSVSILIFYEPWLLGNVMTWIPGKGGV